MAKGKMDKTSHRSHVRMQHDLREGKNDRSSDAPDNERHQMLACTERVHGMPHTLVALRAHNPCGKWRLKRAQFNGTQSDSLSWWPAGWGHPHLYI